MGYICRILIKPGNIALIVIILLIWSSLSLSGQDKSDKRIIHLFGRTLTDSLHPIPYAHIILKNKNLATASDLHGVFSLVTQENDTILFRALGYKQKEIIVRDTFLVKYPILDMVLTQDTIQLRELVIRPWQGNYERFKQAVLSYQLPITDLDRAYKNLEILDIQSILYNSPPTPTIAFKNTMQMYNDKLYWAGQLPPVNITNPLAWAQFFKALKDGDFKKK